MPITPLTNEIQREAVIKMIAVLNLSKPWQIEIKRHTKQRTLNQNSYYWSVVQLIANDTGNSSDDIHEALKSMFCPVRTVMVDGEAYQTRSTVKLSTKDFGEYVDKVIAWAQSQRGMILPAKEYEA